MAHVVSSDCGGESSHEVPQLLRSIQEIEMVQDLAEAISGRGHRPAQRRQMETADDPQTAVNLGKALFPSLLLLRQCSC